MAYEVSKPSRKIIVLAVCAAICITLLVVNKFWPRHDKAVSLEAIGSKNAALGIKSDIATTDQNGNGTPDWKEMLLEATRTDEASSTDSEPKTVTEAVGRDLLASTIYMTQNGQTDMAAGDQSAIVDGLVSKLQNAFVFKTYRLEDIKVSDDTKEALRAYATAVAAYQVNLILEMQANSQKIESDLGVLGDIYATHADRLAQVSVPSSIAEKHLAIINNFSKSAAAFAAFKREKEDPIIVPLALRAYQDASTEQDLLLRQLAQYFTDNDILFTQNEIGIYWDSFATVQ